MTFDDDFDPIESAASDAADGGPGRDTPDAVRRRAEEFVKVRALLADVPPPDPVRRRRAIDAALRTYDEITTAERPVGRPPAPVISLAQRRRRGLLGPAAAVAALAAAAAGFVLLGPNRTSGDDLDSAATRVAVAESDAGNALDAPAAAPPVPPLASRAEPVASLGPNSTRTDDNTAPQAPGAAMGPNSGTAFPTAATPAELRQLLARLPLAELPPVCRAPIGPGETVRGPVLWRPAARPVLAVVATTGTVRLLAQDDCLEVAVIALA